MFDVNRRTFVGAAVAGVAGIVFRYPLSFTGFIIFAGLLGGLVAGPQLTKYESPLYHGGVVGTLGAAPYVAARLLASEGFVGIWPALLEVVGMFVFFLFGGIAGAVLGKRFLGGRVFGADPAGE